MNITLPVGSQIQRIEGNVVTIIHDGHTTALPYFSIFRFVPLVGDVWTYRVKTVRAQQDAITGKVMYSAEEDVNRNITFQDDAEIAAMRTVHKNIVASASVILAARLTGALPHVLE